MSNDAPRPRVLPHDERAERSVIGGLLFDGKSLDDVQPLLSSPDAFYDAKHAAIYAAILTLASQSVPVDMLTVASEMHRAGTMARLGAVNNEAYLAELAGEAVTAAQPQHAQIVRDLSMLRGLALAASRIEAAALSGQKTVAEVVAAAQQEIGAVTDAAISGAPKHIKAVLHESFRELEKRYQQKQVVTGIPTGLQDLDEATCGWQDTDLIIVAARPSMGKTALAAETLLAAARSGARVLFFSIEMGRVLIGNRLLSNDGQVDGTALRSGFLESKDWARLMQAAGRLSLLPVWVEDTSNHTISTLSAKARKWRRSKEAFPKGDEPALVVIDYLQLLSDDDARESNRERTISKISRGLKALAKDLGCPVIALSQLSRAVESRADKRPMQSDLRESGSIEQDADVILFLYRDEYYNPESEAKGIAEIIIGKQRNGPTTTVKAHFKNEYTRFYDLSHKG